MDRPLDYETAVRVIGELERRLSAPRVALGMRALGEPLESRYHKLRLELAVAHAALANATYAGIQTRFQQLDEDLRAGIDNLKREIDALENLVKIVTLIEIVLGIIGRIVGVPVPGE